MLDVMCLLTMRGMGLCRAAKPQARSECGILWIETYRGEGRYIIPAKPQA